MSIFGDLVATVPCIMVICYAIGAACKATDKVKDKMIPVIMGLLGGVLGIVGLKVMPEFPAHDVLNAMAVGIASGFAATGLNQVFKQLQKDE